MRVYVASSWRNELQQQVVALLRDKGLLVYDFKNPTEGDKGFAWSDIDPKWQDWEPGESIKALEHPIAVAGFSMDFAAMALADVCVLVLPCGRSAHLEAGYFVGAGKPLHILMMVRQEPELMYAMSTAIWTDAYKMAQHLREQSK